MNILKRVAHILHVMEWLWMTVASFVMFAVMIIVFVDVAARYIFRSPLTWSYDVISLYLMAALFFLSLSDTLQKNHHINVDMLFRHVSPRTRHVLECIGNALSLTVISGICYEGAIRAWESFAAGEVTSGVIPWPTWISAALIPVGAGLLLLRMLFRVPAFFLAAVTGSDKAVGLPDWTPAEEEL